VKISACVTPETGEVSHACVGEDRRRLDASDWRPYHDGEVPKRLSSDLQPSQPTSRESYGDVRGFRLNDLLLAVAAAPYPGSGGSRERSDQAEQPHRVLDDRVVE
jgi:hypothetical protein